MSIQDGAPKLTAQEIEILQLVLEGRTNDEIAHKKNIACGTVKRHLHDINIKMTAKNRSEAVYIALGFKIIMCPCCGGEKR